MTNFEKIKNLWTIDEFSSFAINLVKKTLEMCGIEVPQKDIDEIIKEYKVWLNLED